MIAQFYDKFQEWGKCGTVWIYSDPHFSDEELRAGVPKRPDDEELVKRINSCVGKKDVFICLGDVGNVDFVRKIKGYKILICGNHDVGVSNYIRKKICVSYSASYDEAELRKQLVTANPGCEIQVHNIIRKDGSMLEAYIDNHLFDEVYEGPLMVGPKILLSHEPLDISWALNIHGHDHSPASKNDKTHFNVCADKIDYIPINLNQLLKSGILAHIPNIHRITIDKATKKKKGGNPKWQNQD